jgi:hypothetical protein
MLKEALRDSVFTRRIKHFDASLRERCAQVFFVSAKNKMSEIPFWPVSEKLQPKLTF